MDEIEAEFVKYQELLDAYYDKKERIYQTSRGIAIESKRIICLLHRPRQLNSGCFKEAERRLQTVRDTGLQSLAKELNGEELSMFQSSYSFGLQEYIEALLLFYFLSRKSIPLLEDVRRLLVYTDNQGENYLFLHVSIEDYVGAVMDFGGELTRFTLNSVASGANPNLDCICHVMQRLFICLSLLPCRNRCMSSKLDQFYASVRKVEKARYALSLRCMESEQLALVGCLSTLTINDQYAFPLEREKSTEEESE